MPQVKSALNDLDGRSLAQALSDKGSYSLIIDGFEIELTADDVEIRATAHDELILVEQEGSAVAIDITINEELRLEGIARELVRAINELRRNREFELSDRIEVEIFSDGIVARAAELHKAMIAPEVLATSWNVKSIKESPSELDAFVVEGDSVLLRIVKASSTSGA
jgi:isoleucyl-tRNA synthetase